MREKAPPGELRCQTKILDVFFILELQTGREGSFKGAWRNYEKDGDVRRNFHVKMTMGNVCSSDEDSGNFGC
jgi:hypothetical protein